VIRIRDYILLAFISDKDKPYFKTSKTISRLKPMIEAESTNGTLIRADSLLTPFNLVTGISEMDDATSGQIMSMWIWLYGFVKEDVSLSISTKVKYGEAYFSRLRKYGEDHYLMCLLLDPRVHGVGLSAYGRRKCIDLCLELAMTLLSDLDVDKFFRDMDTYLYKIKWEARPANPVVFWRHYSDLTDLAYVAFVVCSYVPHAASSERNWSAHKRIHTKERACLKVENVAKISQIKHRYRQMSRKELASIIKKYETLMDVTDSLPPEDYLHSMEQGGSTAGEIVDSFSESASESDNEEEEDLVQSINGVFDTYVEPESDPSLPVEDEGVAGITPEWFDVSHEGMRSIRDAMGIYLSRVKNT
jgi:hypothetical protein